VARPAECHQSNGGQMMDEHLPEIFSFGIKELSDDEGPIKGHFQHVIPPNTRTQWMSKTEIQWIACLLIFYLAIFLRSVTFLLLTSVPFISKYYLNESYYSI